MRGKSTRVKLNRQALDAVDLAIADGVHAVGKAIIDTARPPDATPYGEGLVRNGGVITYAGTKKVNGFGLDGRQPKKPRAVRLKNGVIKAIAGFGFPARFVEFGTIHMAAEPFLTPARNAVLPRINSIMRQATAYRLARLR